MDVWLTPPKNRCEIETSETHCQDCLLSLVLLYQMPHDRFIDTVMRGKDVSSGQSTLACLDSVFINRGCLEGLRSVAGNVSRVNSFSSIANSSVSIMLKEST